MRLFDSPAVRKQALLVEFSGLQRACPPGLFVSLSPRGPTLWTGVLFVRSGPYSAAVLRFHICFLNVWPAGPPLIIFESDIFHPLVTPLSTLTYAGDLTNWHGGAATGQQLPPGGFSLRHGFPAWFGSAKGSGTGEARATKDIAVYDVLEYMRTTFSNAEVLDSIPLEDAADEGAWRAWRAQRWNGDETEKTGKMEAAVTDTVSVSETSEWNWDGVWEMRTAKGIAASISVTALYGDSIGGDDVICFGQMDEGQLAVARQSMARSVKQR